MIVRGVLQAGRLKRRPIISVKALKETQNTDAHRVELTNETSSALIHR